MTGKTFNSLIGTFMALALIVVTMCIVFSPVVQSQSCETCFGIGSVQCGPERNKSFFSILKHSVKAKTFKI